MKISVRVFLFWMTVFLLVPALSCPLWADHRTPEVQTVAQDSVSYYRYGDMNFAGADLVITEPSTWGWFWGLHTAGLFPPPPLPDIDFDRELVVVSILGYQTTGGRTPRIDILGVDLDHECNCLRVRVQNNTQGGPLTVITNPYHIVKVARFGTASVFFEHQTP